jgi:hypothetical protein
MDKINLIAKYLKYHWVFTSFITYELFACVLKLTAGINITIPCLYTTVFGIHCLGCGLTTAFIEILKLNPANAWNSNPLVFFIIPMASIFLIRDFMRFNKRIAKPAYTN